MSDAKVIDERHRPATAHAQPVDGGAMAKGTVTPTGKWVFEHKRQFSQENPLAWYGLRNVLNNIVAIVGLVATIVPKRMAMGYAAKWGAVRGYKTFSNVMGHTVLQNSLGVGVSFATWRTMYKLWQRGYDRIFVKPESPEETSQALADAPKHLWRDLKQIGPSEYPATIAAAFALVGIRAGITGGNPSLPANHWKDVAGCAFVAYPAFFEITERLGRDFMIQRGYKDASTNEHIDKDKQTLGEFLFRQVPAIAAGIIPYIHCNNILYRSTGRQLSFNTTQRATTSRIDGYFSPSARRSSLTNASGCSRWAAIFTTVSTTTSPAGPRNRKRRERPCMRYP